MAVIPLRVSNRMGFGMLEVQSIEQAPTPGTVTTFNFNDHPQRRMANFFGGFWVKVPQNTTALTATNTIEFATIGDSSSRVPLYKFDGSPATMADFVTTGGGVRLCFYDKVSNRVMIVGYVP